MNLRNKDKDHIIDAGSSSLVPRRQKSLAEFHGEWVDRDISEDDIEKDESSIEGSSDIYRSFARKLARIKRLSEEEEHDLGMRIINFNDNEAKKKLVLHNMRLALKIAHQYRRDWTNLMDLVQEASAGMAIAAKKWDPKLGVRFGTYAAYWIRAQLTKFIMTNSRLIHTGNTRTGRKVYFSLPQVRRKLLLRGEAPTAENIAAELGEDPKEVELILSRLDSKEASLNVPINDDSDSTLIDTIEGDYESPEKQVTHHEIDTVVKKLITSFEKTIKDERDLAIWRENLIANEPINLVDLGKRYHVSKQRMGQLATRIKRAFRRHVIDHLGPETQLSWLFRED